MRFWKSLLVLLIVVSVVVWLYPSDEQRRGPDDHLVAYVGGMCKVMDRHVDQPNAGVDALFGYYGKHTPDMMKQFGDLLVEIERIQDDRAHDRRAQKANQKLRKAFKRCERTAERFIDAVEDDPRARAKLERGLDRLGRTLEIIFSGAESDSMLDDIRSFPLLR